MKRPELELARIVSTPFEENCYVVWLKGSRECLVIDPGLEPEKILDYLDRAGLVPAAILVTHGHADHIGGIAALKQRWADCPLVIGADEAPKLTDSDLNLSAMIGMPVTSPPADVTVADGDVYRAAGIELEVRSVPGHSTGHVVYVVLDPDRPTVFVGDVIFAGSIGRTDFPGGDFETLAAGIRQELYALPDEAVLLPGHGPPTTVGREKRSNPFVGGR